MSTPRHAWALPGRFPHKTERSCLNGCGVVKVTRHENDQYWTEYWRGLDRVSVDKAPVCEVVEAEIREVETAL